MRHPLAVSAPAKFIYSFKLKCTKLNDDEHSSEFLNNNSLKSLILIISDFLKPALILIMTYNRDLASKITIDHPHMKLPL